MPHKPYQTAFLLLLCAVLSISAQGIPYQPVETETHTDTLRNGSTVEYVMVDSSSIKAVVKPHEKPWTPPPGVELKSNGMAYLFAIGGTLIPIIVGENLVRYYGDPYSTYPPHPPNKTLENTGRLLTTFGFFVGPSLGQYYAGSYSQGNWAIAGRVGAVALMIPLAAVAVSQGLCDYNCDQSGPNPLLVVAAIGGIGLWFGSFVYSFVDTHYAVKRANEKIRARYGFSPELFPSSNGGMKPGMMAWVKF